MTGEIVSTAARRANDRAPPGAEGGPAAALRVFIGVRQSCGRPEKSTIK